MAGKKIERLTPEQEAELPRFRQRYLDIACGGGRIDRDALQARLTEAYALIGKPAPKIFIFDSPAACMLAIKIFKMGEAKLSQLYSQLDSQLRSQLYSQLYSQLRSQLDSQLYSQLDSQLYSQLDSQLRSQLDSQLYSQLYSQLDSQLDSQGLWEGGYLWGSIDLYWLAYCRFGQKIGVRYSADEAMRLDIMEGISMQCGYWWPFDGIVIASEKPSSTRWDDRRRLHCEDGPAVSFADGYSVYSWHGVRLPAEWVENRKTIDPTEILRCENVEQRAAGAACIGWPRMLSALRYKTIDADPDPSHGELIELHLEGLPRPGRFLKAECPRNGTIVEGVPFEIKTVLEAQAWRVGLSPAEFSYPSIRT